MSDVWQRWQQSPYPIIKILLSRFIERQSVLHDLRFPRAVPTIQILGGENDEHVSNGSIAEAIACESVCAIQLTGRYANQEKDDIGSDIPLGTPVARLICP